MTQHNSFSFIFPTITNCWKLTCTYVTCIVFMYLFIISSSYSSFIVIRNLKSYSYNIVLSTYARDIAKIIYSTNVYISIINPLICGRCTLVSIHTSSDRIITAQNVVNMLHILLDFLIYEFCSNCLFLNNVSQ